MPWADDLVHLRNGLRAVGQSRNGLCATDGEHAIDTGNGRSGQHQRIAFATGRRHHHDQFLHAGHLGRNGIHEHGTGVGRASAGHVEADAIERRHLLPEPGAVGFSVFPGILLLPLVIQADAVSCFGQCVTLRVLQAGIGAVQLFARQFELDHGCAVHAVELAGAVDHGRIAACADVAQDVRHRVLDRVVGAGFECQQHVQRLQEIGSAGIQPADPRLAHFFTAPSIASSIGVSRSCFTFSAA